MLSNAHDRRLRPLVVSFLLILALPTVPLADETERAAPVTTETVLGYLEALGGECRTAGTGEIQTEARAGGETYDILVKVDAGHFLVYLAVTDLFALPADHGRRAAVADRIARLNYELALGKVEWNVAGGEVRLSYAFSTEEGLGRRTFTGVLGTLLSAAGPVRRALAESASGSGPPAR